MPGRGECRWDYGQVMPGDVRRRINTEAYLLWCGAGKPFCEDNRFWDAAMQRLVRSECSVTEVRTPGLEEG